MKILRFFLDIFVIFLLTIGTQIGGLVYILSIFIHRMITKKHRKWRKKRYAFGIFASFYLISSLVIVPLVAPQFGRVPLPFFAHKNVQANAVWINLMNRQYVRPELREAVYQVAAKLEQKYPESRIVYLDANFPFLNGFPLLPHLSHNDGKKLDLSFIYKDKTTGKASPGKTPSLLGYGVCDGPRKGEKDYPTICTNKGFWQYSALEKIQFDNSELLVDAKQTAVLVRLFAQHSSIGKIFIEPHLTTRWRLGDLRKIRFHGCHAVRHDDHIHVQL